MPQSEIARYLSQHRGRKFTAAQLCQRTGHSKGAVNFAIAKLIRFRLVKTEVIRARTHFNFEGRILPCKRHLRKVWL
jgi:DNA-binding transcriptional regulator GbsR (MarR family)